MIRAKRLSWFWMILIISALVLTACNSDADDSSGAGPDTNPVATSTAAPTVESGPAEYQSLSIDELASIVENRADEYLIINVHIPYEGEVENTDAHIPYNDLDALTAAIPDKNAPVILYCRSGSMSEQASRVLVEQGYTQIWDVPGGMVAWQASGRELIDK